jgi:fluoride exporter
MGSAPLTPLARLHGRLQREAARRHVIAINAAVAIGGALGAMVRFGLNEALPPGEGAWPWATLIANLSGAFLLGVVAARLMERRPPSTYRAPLFATGLTGALTTFSTFQIEALVLARGGHGGLATAYVGVSIALGLLCVGMGSRLTRFWSAR